MVGLTVAGILQRSCRFSQPEKSRGNQKAIITAAGKSQRNLPCKRWWIATAPPKLRYVFSWRKSFSGIDEICVVVSPGDEAAYAAAAGGQGPACTLSSSASRAATGTRCIVPGISRAASLFAVGGRPLVCERHPKRSAQQLVEIAPPRIAPCRPCRPRTKASCPTTAAWADGWSPAAKPLRITEVLEKPTPTEAEQRLIVPGLRAGHYLCFFACTC